ncbi:MAG: hypothetical protein M8467_07750 [Anaerolineae bacterium]|nr:hypothetical protein [Anaerolineae bacterium]
MYRVKLIRALSMLLFSIGLLLGLALSTVAVWADIEAMRFDRGLTLLRDASLSTLRCPVILDSEKTGTVRASIKNSLDRPVTLLIRAHVSRYLTLMREDVTRLRLEAGETQSLEWAVDSEDIVYEHLILVKVHQHRSYPLLGRTGSCGIVVLDLPGLTGPQVVAGAVAGSLLGIALGLGLWLATARPLGASNLEVVRAMGVVAASAVLVMIASLLGWWLLGGLALIATLLLIGAVVGHFSARR